MELIPWGRTRAVYLAPSEAATFRGLWGDAAQALLRLTRRCVARGLPPPPADELARAAGARRAYDALATRTPVAPTPDWRHDWIDRLPWLHVGHRAAQARAIVARVERRFERDHNVWPF
jgi:hypothetical protein